MIVSSLVVFCELGEKKKSRSKHFIQFNFLCVTSQMIESLCISFGETSAGTLHINMRGSCLDCLLEHQCKCPDEARPPVSFVRLGSP